MWTLGVKKCSKNACDLQMAKNKKKENIHLLHILRDIIINIINIRNFRENESAWQEFFVVMLSMWCHAFQHTYLLQISNSYIITITIQHRSTAICRSTQSMIRKHHITSATRELRKSKTLAKSNATSSINRIAQLWIDINNPKKGKYHINKHLFEFCPLSKVFDKILSIFGTNQPLVWPRVWPVKKDIIFFFLTPTAITL